jgi:predicted nucleotidyltransferase component of viral defense system
MKKKIRELQKKILDVFVKNTKNFALSGGTALELYYLNHRFSADLDFFSPQYKIKEIEDLIYAIKKTLKLK